MSQGRIEPTGSATPASPAPADTSDASVEEIEADITATREQLAESVDALADKVNAVSYTHLTLPTTPYV